MTDPHPSPVGLIEAWAAWERWANKLSAGEIKPNARSGAGVASRLLDCEIEYARHLGMKPTELHTGIIEGVRAGMTVADAIARLEADRVAGLDQELQPEPEVKREDSGGK